jgi:hypothetical protein
MDRFSTCACGRELTTAHESPRTTKLYDRTSDAITLDEGEKISGQLP